MVMEYSGELSKLWHEGHAFHFYQEEFMRISHQVQDRSEEFLVGCSTSGLKDAVKYNVIAKNPTSIMEAIRLARVEEEKLSNIRDLNLLFRREGAPQMFSERGYTQRTLL